MNTRDQNTWLQSIPRPGTLGFYQYRIAELSANACESRMKDGVAGAKWADIFTDIVTTHDKVIKELHKKHPSFQAVSDIPLGPVKEILKIHWEHAAEAGL